MKGFKRYGGEFSGKSYGGNPILLGIALVIFGFGVAGTLVTLNPVPFVLALLLFFILSLLSNVFVSRNSGASQKKRQLQLISEAFKKLEAGERNEAYELFRRATTYGVLLDDAKSVYEKLKSELPHA